MNKNRLRLWMWWVIGMWSVQSGATDSALTTRVESQENGLTITVTVDLSQLRYDPANGGSLILPGCETVRTPGGWALPQRRMTVVLPTNVDVTGCIVQVLPIVWSTTATTPLMRQGKGLRACEDETNLSGLPLPSSETFAQLESAGYHHGVHIQEVLLSPVQLEAVTGKILAASEIVIHLTWATAANPHRWVTPPSTNLEAQRVRADYAFRAINGSQFQQTSEVQAVRAPSVNGTSSATYLPKTPTGTVVGVILAPQALVKYYQLIADDKTRTGSPWEVVTYEWIEAQAAYADGTYQPATFTDSPAKIRAFLTEAYQRYGLEYVLFGGTPPYMPATWDRALHGENWDNRYLFLHRSLGYYTNLDGGHHHEVVLQGQTRNAFVYMAPGGVETTLGITSWNQSQLMEVRTVARCGYLPYFDGRISNLKAALGGQVNTLIGLSLNMDIFGDTPEHYVNTMSATAFTAQVGPSVPFIREAYPQFIGQVVVLATEGNVGNVSSCDRYPELTAGWLPPDPNMGGVSVALYQNKVRHYREPMVPTLEGATSVAGIDPFLLQGMRSLLKEYAQCSNGEGGYAISVNNRIEGVDVFRHALQPLGLLAEYRCVQGSWGHAIAGRYWNSLFTPLVLYPDGGPVVAVTDGLGGFSDFHEGPMLRYDYFTKLRERMPLGRLALWAGGRFSNETILPDWMTWSSGHQAMIYGDPSLAPFTMTEDYRVNIVRPVVTHPDTPRSSFGVTLQTPDSQPITDALVVVSKRKPDGAYAFYQRQRTDGQGVAFLNIGSPADLGPGVIAVEVDQYPPLPQDFYPYHGAIPLTGNRPPIVALNLPTEVALTTPQGTWVVLDAGESDDPDGDAVTVSWTWMDNRTGTLVTRRDTGRYQRAFLPLGATIINITASDGQATATQLFTLTVKDQTPPVVQAAPVTLTHWHSWVTVPIRMNDPVEGGLNFSAIDEGSGMGSWDVTAVVSNDPRQPAPVTFTLLPTNEVKVYADLNSDGTPRIYTVTVRVQDQMGNAATQAGQIVVENPQPRVNCFSGLVRLTQSGNWVEVPINLVSIQSLISSPVAERPNELYFGTFDPRGFAWSRISVQSNEIRRPAPVTFSLQGMTSVRVLTEGNDDLTLRTYRVTAEAVNVLGLTATASTYIGVLPPALLSLWTENGISGTKVDGYQGRVGEGLQDSSGGLVRPPVMNAPEPTPPMIQFARPDGSLTLRAHVDNDGTWITWLPTGEGWNVQTTRGGREFFFLNYVPLVGYQFQSLTPPGIILGSNTRLNPISEGRGAFLSRPRPTGNQAPVARVVPLDPIVTKAPLIPVSLDGRGSSDSDGDLLTYIWRWVRNGVAYSRSGPVMLEDFSQGWTSVTLSVSDGVASASTLVMVRVRTPSGTVVEAQ